MVRIWTRTSNPGVRRVEYGKLATSTVKQTNALRCLSWISEPYFEILWPNSTKHQHNVSTPQQLPRLLVGRYHATAASHSGQAACSQHLRRCEPLTQQNPDACRLVSPWSCGRPQGPSQKELPPVTVSKNMIFFGNPCRAPGFSQPVCLSEVWARWKSIINTMWNV